MSNDQRGGGNPGRIATWTEDGVFLIGIDRPAKRNGFSPKMMRELAEAYHAYETDDTLRCAVLYAEGAHFTAGLDLSLIDLSEPTFPPDLVDPVGLRPPWRSKPIVCAVQGITFTLGIELMLAADITVAARDCRFAMLEVKRGLYPLGGATIRMVQSAGWGNAMRYLLTGDEFDAETALRLGFVQELAEPGQQHERARALARTIAAQAPLGVRGTIASAREALLDGHEAAVAGDRERVEGILASHDLQEGVRAFKERRDPAFEGR